MKKISILFFLLAIALTSTIAQSSKQQCNLGITFEISNNPSWGYGEPVILSVEPYSPADKAGLKVDDIIMEINSTATYLRNYPTIENWLTDNTDSQIRLTIRNTDTYFKEYTVTRNCAPKNARSEFDLASTYSFYSVQSTSNRAFSIPLKVVPNKDVNYADYNTFSFIVDNRGATALDIYITSQVQKALESRGLVRDDINPSMLVQTYYSYQTNLKYDYLKTDKVVKTWRFDTETQQMILLPILSAEDPQAESKGEYILELGIRFYDNKNIDPNNLTQIWDCSSREFLSENYGLEEYSRIHAPLMLMQYPYSSAKTIAKYIVDFKKFNYTGLYFDLSDMSLVQAVDYGSAAYQAGLRPGDRIVKINQNKFDYTKQELENGYKRFIVETMSLRDPKTKFINASGFPDCMYWSKSKIVQVKEAFSKPFYDTSFSYLYAFEKYIANTNILEIEFKRGNKKNKVRINPQIQSSVVVRAINK